MSPERCATLVDLLVARGEEFPGRPAFTFLTDGEAEGDRLSFGELDLRSRALAAMLQRRHAPGERALLLYPPGLEFIVAFFGCLYAGLVAVPAYPPRPSHPERWAPRLGGIARDAEPAVVLGTEAMVALMPLVQREIPELRRARWLQTSTLPLSNAGHWQPPGAGPDTLALLQYTSGSTSDPKGVMVAHGNLLHNLACARRVEENGADSVSVSWLPVYHDMGLIEAVLQPVFGAFPAYLMPPAAFLQRPLRWLEAITRYRATNSGGPNFAYELCCSRSTPEERRRLDLSSWRVAYNGSEPVRWETLQRFHEAFREAGFRWRSFYPVYGLAEATLVVSSGQQSYEPRCLAVSEERGRPAGQALSPRSLTACGPWVEGTRVEIVAQGTADPCPEGEVGEIWIKGPSVAKGYWRRGEETARTFQARLSGGDGPFLRTGDLGLVDRGELVPAGRIKDLIIVRGRKHYPQDIERTAEASDPSIRQGHVAAFGVNLEGEERLAIVAELERRHVRSTGAYQEVLAALRETVARRHEIQPQAVALLPPGSIPKTSSGKIRRFQCRENLLEETFQPLACWWGQAWPKEGAGAV